MQDIDGLAKPYRVHRPKSIADVILDDSPILTLLVWLLALLALASATYWLIERPMIAWGQRLTRSAAGRPSAAHAPAAEPQS